MTQYRPSINNTGSYICDLCEKAIPTKKNVLQDWIAFGIWGMFCSFECADTASGDATYQPISNRQLV
jgi:hypothetical protein